MFLIDVYLIKKKKSTGGEPNLYFYIHNRVKKIIINKKIKERAKYNIIN